MISAEQWLHVLPFGHNFVLTGPYVKNIGPEMEAQQCTKYMKMGLGNTQLKLPKSIIENRKLSSCSDRHPHGKKKTLAAWRKETRE